MADTARTIRVVIDSSGAKSGAQQVNQALSSIGKNAGSASGDLSRLKSANDNAASSANRHRAANDNLAKSVGNLRGLFGQASGELGTLGGAAEGAAARMGTFASVARGLAGLGVVGILGGIAVALGAIGVASVGAAAKVQTYKANLLTMTKSAEAAEGAWAELVQFSKNTPFDLSQSVEGFTKLRALGLQTSTEIMTSYGNTSAAMGKSMEQMIEAVADATTGEFERLKEFGIKASKEGDKVKFTFQGVTKEVGNNSKEIQDYLVGIGNTNFAGAMDRQMATIGGAFAGLSDTVDQLIASLGDGPFGAAVADMVNTLSSGIAAVTPLLSGIMDIFGGLISFVWDVTKGLTSLFASGEQGASNLQSGLDNLAVAFSFVGEWVTLAGKVIGSVFTFAGNLIGTVVGGIQDSFAYMFNWLVPNTQIAGQSMGESFVGILRAATYVAGQLPNIFAVALAELKAMFMQAGSAMAASLTGDFSKWGNVDISFGRTRKVAGAVLANAGKVQQDQKANRDWIDSRTSKGRAGNIDFDAAGGGAASAAKPDKKGADKAAQEAERRAKAQKEFWEGMEKELELSKLTTQQAEIRRKEMEYEKIVGRDITADEKKRLVSLIEQAKANEYLQRASEDHRNKMIELASQQEILEARLNGASAERLEIKKAIEERIVDLKKQGINLSDTQLENIKKQVAEESKKSAEIAKQNAMLDKASELAKQYSATRQKADREKEYKDNVEALTYALEHGKISEAIYNETIAGMKKAVEEVKYTAIAEFGGVISRLGDDIKGKWGAAISAIGDAIQNMAAMAKGNTANSGPLGRIASLFGGSVESAFGEGAKEIMGGLKGLGKDITKTLGIDGAFGKTLGKALGKAGAGAEVGAATDSVMKAIGIKSSKTGAQIGGAIGSFIPIPGASIVGSILGGVVGGLFKKAKWGTASIAMGEDGHLSVGSVRGNKSAYKKNSDTAAGSVISGIEGIAEALGATISGSPNISIGQYKGKWRVSNIGRTGKLKGGSGRTDIKDFGKDGAEEAVAYAVSEALKQGILTGISDFSQRVLKTLDTDEAVSLAQSYEGILKSIAAYKNPIKGAVDEVVSSIDTLAEQMKKAGATSAELANVEEYRAIKLQEVLKSQVSGFQDLLEELNGDSSGKSQLTLLGEDMAKMNELRKTLATGGTVDQAAFTTLGQSIMGRAQDIYGAQTSSYQSIRSDLIALSEQALGNASNAFNAAAAASDTYTAITDQTDQVTESIATTNDLLSQILSAFTNGNTSASNALKAINGSLIKYS